MSTTRFNWIAGIAAVGTLLGGVAALIAVVGGDHGERNDALVGARALAQYEAACLAQVKSGTELGKNCGGDRVCLSVVFAHADRDRQICRCASERLGKQFRAAELQKIAKIERAQSLMSAGQTYSEAFAGEISEATKYLLESREIANASDTAQSICLAASRDTSD